MSKNCKVNIAILLKQNAMYVLACLRAALDKADDTHSMGVQFGTQSFESIISFRTTCKAHLLEHKNSDTACKQAVCVTNLFVTLLFVNALIRKTEDTRWKQF